MSSYYVPLLAAENEVSTTREAIIIRGTGAVGAAVRETTGGAVREGMEASIVSLSTDQDTRGVKIWLGRKIKIGGWWCVERHRI